MHMAFPHGPARVHSVSIRDLAQPAGPQSISFQSMSCPVAPVTWGPLTLAPMPCGAVGVNTYRLCGGEDTGMMPLGGRGRSGMHMKRVSTNCTSCSTLQTEPVKDHTNDITHHTHGDLTEKNNAEWRGRIQRSRGFGRMISQISRWFNPQFEHKTNVLTLVRGSLSQIPQPVTLFQQLPAALASPVPSLRPGHVREDLVELMMMQNAQMHQVIMNNMTMAALRSFGCTNTPEQSIPAVVSEEDPEVYHHHYLYAPEVYHHHYPYAPCLSSPVWLPQPLPVPQCEVLLPQTIQSFQDPPHSPEAVCTDHRAITDRSENTT
ncbi:hypothetical protein P4O66_007554, partial [Electrophorus voltai]